VTLFASGDSITSAELVPCCARALRLDPDVCDVNPRSMMRMIDKVASAQTNSMFFVFTPTCSISRFSARWQLAP
jgi:hypothetical protein